jgi:hypothetical protein
MSNARYEYAARPRRYGCLLGCLGVMVLVSAPFIFAWGYSAWFLYSGFRDSPMMRTIVEMTERDGLAQQVLGAPIVVMGLQGNVFTYIPGRGTRDEYTLLLQGARAMGTLSVATGSGAGRAKIESMILTGPDGRRYDLLTDTPLPGNGTTPKLEDTI